MYKRDRRLKRDQGLQDSTVLLLYLATHPSHLMMRRITRITVARILFTADGASHFQYHDILKLHIWTP